MGGEGSRSWFGGGLHVIMESQLCTNVQQHVVLEDTNQGGGNLALCSKGRPVEGALEEVEGGDQPLNCLVTIAGAMDGDRRDSQGSASPWASPECPGPGGGMCLHMVQDPGRDSRGEENCVDERLWYEVETMTDL